MSKLRGKQHWQRVQADIDRTAQTNRDADREAMQARAIAYRKKRAGQPVEPAELMGATAVKDQHGVWHEVVRINSTTVTVLTGQSWHDRIPHDRIFDVHHGDRSAS